MPCKRTGGTKITTGCITKTEKMTANVTIGYPNRVPYHQLSSIYVETSSEGKGGSDIVTLRFKKLATTGGDIRFSRDNGSETRQFSGDTRQLVAIYGQSATSGDPDVILEVIIDENLDTPTQLQPSTSLPSRQSTVPEDARRSSSPAGAISPCPL